MFLSTGTATRRLGLALVLTLALCGTASAMAAEDWQILNQGKVVIKQSTPANTAPSVEAQILIPKPPQKVWSVVADPERLMRQEQKVKKVKVLSRSGNSQNVEFSVLMTHLLPPFNYVLQQDLSPPSLLRFHRVSGSFKDIQGAWRLIPVENGSKTVLSYTLKLDPGPLVPKGMLINAVKADLPTMMQNARTAINSAP